MKSTRLLPVAKLQASEAHVDAFAALSHLSRLKVFFFLVKTAAEVSAGEIQRALDIPAPTLSHHLDILRRAGLIASRKEERFVYYGVRSETVTDLIRILSACC